MKAIFSKQITIIDPTPDVMSWCERELTITNPLWDNLMKRGQRDLIMRRHVPQFSKFHIRRGNEVIIPFGCLYAIWPLLRNCGIETDFAPDAPSAIATMENASGKTLRDYQEEAVSALLKAKGGIVQAGCGAGKTILAIELVKAIGKRTLWICHTKDLLRQAKEDFLELYPNLDIGLITEGKVELGKDITISTVQTLCNIDPGIYRDYFNVVIVDECHKAASDITKIRMYDKVLGNIKARYRYGLSATVFRADTLGKTLYYQFGCHPSGEFRPVFVVERERIKVMNAKFVEFPVSTPFSYSMLLPDGTFDINLMLDYLCESEVRNKEICDEVRRLEQEGRKIVVLSKRKQHCALLTDMLEESGCNVRCVTGETAKKKRVQTIDHPEEWNVLVATLELLKEGLDIATIDTVMLVHPVKDKTAVIQSCGRCERYLEGKKQPLFISVCDENIPYCKSATRKQKSYIKNRE